VDPECIFCKIVAGEIPSSKVLENDEVLAFRDIRPQAPVHTLVIPRAHHPSMAALAEADPRLASAVLAGAAAVARTEGIADSGYRMIVNTGPDAGMEVPHAHVHVLGGKPLGRMLPG
jgi:histidine triad (HIT) family protein